ncbi:phage tail-collar fiber domain-containing protein [Aeromonas veronii]|uniref:phage tail-collar fiber domain-containing protein n=1 Tax=Aeromonas veronii TaxID=654 RepID=UPI002B475123|nr:phage tail protein [Aeromonas veronii]
MTTQTYFTVLTAIGAAKLANLAATSRPLKLTQFAVGTGGGDSYAPTAEQLRQATRLIDETFRGPIAVLEQDANLPSQYYMEGYVPIDVGPFIVREAGWFDADGDMIFATRYPPVEKTIPAQGAQVDLPLGTYVSIHQVDGGQIQILVDPSKVLASRQFVENAWRTWAASVPITANITLQQTAGQYPANVRFMAPAVVTISDSWPTGSRLCVIVDHSVDMAAGDCIIRLSTGTISTPQGSDQQVRIIETGREFVFEKITGTWRVS